MEIAVEQIQEEPWEFAVGLREEDNNLGDYIVVMDTSEYDRYGGGAEPQEVVVATFQFLLEREEPEMIQERFSLTDVESYFPDFPEQISSYL